MGDVWMQHNRAPAHFTCSVHDILDWPCSPTFPTPLFWPSQSYHNGQLFVGHYQGTSGCIPLSQQWQVTQSCGIGIHNHYTTNALARHRMWRCKRLCFQYNGAHTDPFEGQRLSPHGIISRCMVTSHSSCAAALAAYMKYFHTYKDAFSWSVIQVLYIWISLRNSLLKLLHFLC